MSMKLRFAAYCVEIYKAAKNISGKEAYRIFSENNVFNYLLDCWEALHTTGAEYTINSIDKFMAKG